MMLFKWKTKWVQSPKGLQFVSYTVKLLMTCSTYLLFAYRAENGKKKIYTKYFVQNINIHAIPFTKIVAHRKSGIRPLDGNSYIGAATSLC